MLNTIDIEDLICILNSLKHRWYIYYQSLRRSDLNTTLWKIGARILLMSFMVVLEEWYLENDFILDSKFYFLTDSYVTCSLRFEIISKEILRETIQFKYSRVATCFPSLYFLFFQSQLSVTTTMTTMTTIMTTQVFFYSIALISFYFQSSRLLWLLLYKSLVPGLQYLWRRLLYGEGNVGWD